MVTRHNNTWAIEATRPNAPSAITFALDIPEWMEQSLCAQVDGDLWFAGKGENDKVKQAKEICSRCEVREQCLQFALDSPEKLEGIWGGLSEKERRPLRREGRINRAWQAA